MFERYTEKARRVIFFARYEASQFGSPYIETEHLLLGLLREEKCFAAEILREHGLQLSAIREELQRTAHENVPRREFSRELKPSAAHQLLAADFRDVSCRRLGQMTEYLTACMKKLTDEQIWRRRGAYENAVGNLVLHLCGNARQWIMHGVGGAPDVRVRDKEFSADGEMSGAELILLFESTMTEAKGVIAGVTAERMVERTTPQGRDVSVLEAIYQVVTHVHQHVGQIILVTKQMLATDIDLTAPRPR